MRSHMPPAAQRGALMIEVLVTIVICVIGLWGLTKVQSRLQMSEVESYQRSQALMLMEDMSTRVELNRINAASYVTGSNSPLGTGTTCSTSTSPLAARDLGDWCDMLQGAAETSSSSARVGSMVGARGCIENIGTNQYMITVAWQGMSPLTAPPSSVACGANSYNTTGTACVNDLCRRTITTVVRIGNLDS
jgi:type IV pilus assembly protein PilV